MFFVLGHNLHSHRCSNELRFCNKNYFDTSQVLVFEVNPDAVIGNK